jgi:hypothetical protein
MVAWPATLPDFASSYATSGSFGEGRSVTPTDSGRMQVRVASGAPPHPISVEVDLTGTQVDALRTFYFVTLEGGALPFTHVDMFTGSAATYQFKPDEPPPQFSKLGTRDDGSRGTWSWRIRFSLLQIT